MPAPPVLPPSWLQVLETIERSLAEMVRDSERESLPPPPPPADRDAGWREALARLDDRLGALDDCAGRASRAAAEADAALASAAEGLNGWLPVAGAALRNVADRADGAV
jgi:hypothetical protein